MPVPTTETGLASVVALNILVDLRRVQGASFQFAEMRQDEVKIGAIDTLVELRYLNTTQTRDPQLAAAG
jgi:hypothetical protein